jgi:hypothetical protein
VLIDCVAEEIARRLITPESKAEFLQNGAFFCNAGLYCQPNCAHSEDIECLPSLLSQLIAQKMLEQSHAARAHILQNAPVDCRVLQGHTDYVASLCIAGNKIVSGSVDRTIRIWDINTGQCLKILHGHTGSIFSVCVAGDRIVSGSDDNTIRIWAMQQFNACSSYLQKNITIEQAILLLCSYDAMQQNTPLDLANCPQLMAIFNSIDCLVIREILVNTKMVYTETSISHWLLPNRRLAIAATALSTAIIAGWALWRL